jgi:hypothetical protein
MSGRAAQVPRPSTLAIFSSSGLHSGTPHVYYVCRKQQEWQLKSQPGNQVAVIACGSEMPEELRRMCERNGWLCIIADQAIQALRALCGRCVLVVVIQMRGSDPASLAVVELLGSHARNASIVAMVPRHAENTERDVRAAGAHWYLAGDAATSRLECMVMSILENRGKAPCVTAKAGRIRNVRQNSLSSS